MKKRILALLLAVATLAAMIVVPGYAAEEAAAQTPVGYCQHCKQQIPDDKWLPWDALNTGPRTGHYYLAEDITTQPKQITINLMTCFAMRSVWISGAAPIP